MYNYSREPLLVLFVGSNITKPVDRFIKDTSPNDNDVLIMITDIGSMVCHAILEIDVFVDVSKLLNYMIK